MMALTSRIRRSIDNLAQNRKFEKMKIKKSKVENREMESSTINVPYFLNIL